jgi:transposase
MVKQTKGLQLALIHPQTAAIDIGSMLMMVSYSDAQGNQCLLETDGFTQSLETLSQTLKDAGVTSVAMEATGVYWMSLYEILERKGLSVVLINPRHFKNVDAQKTDVKDCQWIQQLHAHGLLRASHIAPEVYRELKLYVHERNILQQQKSDTLNRMHRLLTMMNVKVQHVISDMEGVAGMKILQAIGQGLQEPEEMLSTLSPTEIKRLKAGREQLLKSLKGIYKPQHITILNQLMKSYSFFKEQMLAYEKLMEQVLIRMLPEDELGNKPVIAGKKGHVRKNQYSINLKGYLEKIAGIDLTKIDGLDEISVLEILSVTGVDMSKWPTAEHFSSWLNLSPRPKISGGKILGYQKRFTNNRATQAFRLAAQTMWQHKGALGSLYKRLSAQKGSKKAIKAIARKLAVIFYTMLNNKTEYDTNRMQLNPEKQKTKKIASLQKEALKYGYSLQLVTA